MSRLKACPSVQGPSVQGRGIAVGPGRRAVIFCMFALASLGVHAQTLPDFTGIVEKNAPTVVHVEAKYTGKARTGKGGRGADSQGMPDDQMEIFRRFFGMPMTPSPQEQARTSVGSGFIISPDGYILTNNHVVDDADEVSVRLQDRRTLTAKVVGTDPQYDIALLKLDAGQLPAVSIGDSRLLKPGQWVLAIGSPFGFDYTVTQGIVSAVGRNLGSGDQPYTSFIQTDVPINRGNSGGPLFNLQGQVVGVNSQIYSNTGGYIGVAFSIPIDVAMNVVQQIKEKGYVSRGMLGVQVQPVDDFVKTMKLPNANGALIGDVGSGSGAEKAGLRQGDVIVAFNGQPINQAADLPPLVGMTKPHSQADVTILRDGKKEIVKVTIGEVPRDSSAASMMRGGERGGPPAQSGAAALGLSVQDIGLAQRQQLGIKTGQGVVITRVTGDAGADAGLQPGDVILAVNQKRVDSAAGFREAAKAIRPGDTAMLLVSRDQVTRFVGLTVPEAR
jgi:serine protease Do